MLLFKRALITVIVVMLLSSIGWLYMESDPNRPTPSEQAEVPVFIGAPAIATPVQAALELPIIQHPFLAKNGINSMHNDSAQSDSYRWAGPLGNQ